MDDVFSLKGSERLYEVLGVAKTASAAQIKRAYHKLAIQCHPDKSRDPRDAERFKAISFAYNILSDDEQRRLYDSHALRTHLEGHRKEYDPMMDPNVELTPEDLCKFVEKIRQDHERAAARQAEFEQRRQAEMQRRAEYERAHPNFKMAEVHCGTAHTRSSSSCSSTNTSPTASLSAASAPLLAQGHRTTADIKEALQRLEQNTSGGSHDGDPLAHLRAPRTTPSSAKAQMMSQFRHARREHGVSTVAQTSAVRPEDVRDLDDARLRFVKEATAVPSYADEVTHRISTRSNFDYTTFVSRGFVDGGAVGDAILADALNDYDPHQ